MAGLLDEVMDAHGGLARWRGAQRVRAALSTGGALFTMRTTPGVFRRSEIVVDLHRPHVEMPNFPRRGVNGVFEADRVWLTDGSGTTIAERTNPRAYFGGVWRQLHWDYLNAVYFAGYAVWNYFTTPFLFFDEALTVQEGEDWTDQGERRRTLRVRFPDGVPNHCAEQSFHFDDRGYLRRHDYTAEVVGSYATAAHFCDEHREFGGAVFPTRRVVLPRTRGGGVRPFPKLVWIDVHEASLEGD